MTTPCPDRRTELAALAAGELDASRCAILEKHVEICERCRNELTGLRAVVHALPDLAPPDTLVEAAHRRLDQRLGWLDRRRRAARMRLISGLAAAAVLLLGFRLMWGVVGSELRVPTIDPRPMVQEALEKLPIENLSIGLDWMSSHETDR